MERRYQWWDGIRFVEDYVLLFSLIGVWIRFREEEGGDGQKGHKSLF